VNEWLGEVDEAKCWKKMKGIVRKPKITPKI